MHTYMHTYIHACIQIWEVSRAQLLCQLLLAITELFFLLFLTNFFLACAGYMGTPQANADGYQRSSVMTHVDKIEVLE